MKRQHGASLIEALVAFLVLSLGLVAMARLQNQLRFNADIARQRSEAVRLAQEDIETLRAFATIGAAPGLQAYADIVPATHHEDAESGLPSNTAFELVRDVDADASGRVAAAVTVRWLDRGGETREVQLHTLIAGTHPALSGALAAQSGGQPLRRVHGRSAMVPRGAKDLGDGRSVLKPAAAATLAFVFDNTSGEVIAHCDVAANVATAALTADHLHACTPRDARLLSGTVRFSTTLPPDASQPASAALALAMTLAPTGGPYPGSPVCAVEKLAHAVTYHCSIAPDAHGRWSGRTAIEPIGWTLGSGAADHKVCRYSGDHDDSGAIDTNAEHPNDYSDVDTNLMQQNFLVIRGDQSCPLAPAIDVDASGAEIYADLATVQHQP